jgi:hypothetical protein
VNASEFAFLAVGLILGVASGAALVEVLRARPPAPREVRVTVSQDAIPRRRGTTLAEDAFAVAIPEPARGGPADHEIDGVPDRDGDGYRTTVRHGVSMPAGVVAMAMTAPPAMVGFRVEPGHDPAFQAMAMAASDTEPAKTVAIARTAVAVLEPEGDAMAGIRSDEALGSGGGGAPLATPATDGPCAEVRQVATERCELAVRARAGVGVADETLRNAQRVYDAHVARAEAATAATDPGAVRRDKELAQAAFREARGRAGSPEAIESAARDWLGEINRINTVVRDAGSVAGKEREAAAAIEPSLERLALEADAARNSAEVAEEACVAARQAVADCVEAEAALIRAARPAAPPAASESGPGESGPGESGPREPGPGTSGPGEPGPGLSGPGPGEIEHEPLVAALSAGQTPVIFLLLRGDGAAMGRTVARLADDPAEQRRWQASLSELVDAVLAVSISQSALDFPHDHAFWGPFTNEQDRDIVTALSSLGFRFDGHGGWADDRIPSQRDLSMALGYAGLDPMRIRRWPNEDEMRSLLADVTVAADEHLAGAAGDLTLGELVAMLGRRADGLATLWNDWGRVRPLLLEDA